MSNFQALITDLETAIQDGQQDKRVAILRQVTDLFVLGAQGFNEDHIGLFGDVLMRLANQVEGRVLAELSTKLAPVVNAPNGIIQRLARDDEIAVAGPVLTQSPRLSDGDLIEIARSKGQPHLGAISERERLAAAVTDVLVERGDTTVVRQLSLNRGAAFSEAGFNALAQRAQNDEQLAENLGGRVDLPPELFRELMVRATEEVRARLLRGASPERRADIQKMIDAASAQVADEASARRDFSPAEKIVDAMKQKGQLSELSIATFAQHGAYEEMIVALSRLSLAPIDMIEPLVQNPAYDGLLTACKACDFSWKTFSAILSHRFPDHPMSTAELDKACADYYKVQTATAKRVYRFWLVQGVAESH